MGQKVHPKVMRIGVSTTWDSLWFDDKKYADTLHEDLKIRRFLKKRLERAEVGRVVIARFAKDKLGIDIHTARPAIVIGRKGAEKDKLTSEIAILIGKDVSIRIIEIIVPQLSAQIVANTIGRQLATRVHYKRAMKQAITAALSKGARGIKVQCSGRLAGTDIARSEYYREGQIPLATFRIFVDYGYNQVKTKFGAIGVKVWIYRGETESRAGEGSKGLLMGMGGKG